MKILINGYTIGEHIKYRSTSIGERIKYRNITMDENIEYISVSKCELEREVGKLENLLNHLKKNRRLYFKLVYIVSIMFMSGYISPELCGIATYAADVNQAITKINGLGKQILELVRTIGYWTIIIITSTDCIKQALNGDKKGVGGSITKGVMIMATLYFLPELFDMMKSIIETDGVSK